MTRTQYCFDTLELKVNNTFKLIDQICNLDSTVLVTGKSGTGKEAISHLLHMKSKRSTNPFVPVNCSAIPENLIESELFGHEAGSFTGADSSHMGRFEQASGGTIILDEISGMSLKIQSKLLRVLESREFYKVGGSIPKKLNARIIVTTSKDLKECIELGTFREDLYFRLDVMRVELPTLKDRARDIPLLADFFLNRLIEENSRNVSFSPEIYHFLCQKEWEGNIRELKNFVTRLYFLADREILTIHDLYNDMANIDMPVDQFITPSANLSLDEVEKQYILHTMNLAQGNKSQAARTLKISLKTLRTKLKEYDYQNLNTSMIAAQKVKAQTDTRSA